MILTSYVYRLKTFSRKFLAFYCVVVFLFSLPIYPQSHCALLRSSPIFRQFFVFRKTVFQITAELLRTTTILSTQTRKNRKFVTPASTKKVASSHNHQKIFPNILVKSNISPQRYACLLRALPYQCVKKIVLRLSRCQAPVAYTKSLGLFALL